MAALREAYRKEFIAMSKPVVSIVGYEKPLESLRRAVDLCGGLDHLPPRARVFIKPNIVF